MPLRPHLVEMADDESIRAAALAAANDDDSTLRTLLQGGMSANASALFQMRFQIHGRPAASPEARLPLLLIAAQSGAPESVKVLLESRADPAVRVDNRYDGMGTALDAAFAFHRQLGRPFDLDCARLIIEAKVNPNEYGRTPDGCTELMIACQDGDVATARFLLDHFADPNLGKNNGSTALYKAAQGGHTEACRMLLHARAHIDARFSSGATALGAAACGGHESTIRLLLSLHADATVVASDGLTPSGMARANGHHAAAALVERPLVEPPPRLLAAGTRVTIQGLQSKPELNGQAAAVLEFDRTNGRYSTRLGSGLSLSLKPANVVALDLSAEGHAERHPSTPIDAVDLAVDLSDGAAAPARPAAVTASTPVLPTEVWQLLTSGGNSVGWASSLVRRRDFDLAHAFPAPANQSSVGKTTHLLALAAGLMRKKNARGPLDATNLVGQPALIKALLESGADANALTEAGATALHIACASSIEAHVALLLAHGADVNAVANGTTPLMELMGQANQASTDERRLACLKLLAVGGQLQVRTPQRAPTRPHAPQPHTLQRPPPSPPPCVCACACVCAARSISRTARATRPLWRPSSGAGARRSCTPSSRSGQTSTRRRGTRGSRLWRQLPWATHPCTPPSSSSCSTQRRMPPSSSLSRASHTARGRR